MNKVIIIALLFCIGFVVAGCEKEYSVEDFKKDAKLRKEWKEKCNKIELSSITKSQNCINLVQANADLVQENSEKILKELLGNNKKGHKTRK
ncbi:EexN family lipoprotein [Bartonella krasnovii]|uniref:EexN family lipoprotein n=1 Tax=Bartonella krasnovii TaxID=2267275 RepID=UPI001F4D1B2B|nr:EexN family lipoprotein [Bartonella krasnovii]UNF43363.1 EexN family lipoprotein [Bartonella krasnovii]